MSEGREYNRNGEIFADTPWPDDMHRIALAVEYHGASFRGFQIQPGDVASVQKSLHKALSIVADEPVTLVCAGRTDAGVHATGQIVHVDTRALRPERAWIFGTRPHLPPGISIRWAREVSRFFHARFSAQARTYRYLLSDAPTCSGLLHD